jgi:hypothetical protein
MSNQISSALQRLIDGLSASSATGASVAQMITAAINQSPALANTLNTEVADYQLKGFDTNAAINAGAQANTDKGLISFYEPSLANGTLSDNVFVLAHEAQHLANAATINGSNIIPVSSTDNMLTNVDVNSNAADNAFSNGIKNLVALGSNQTVTDLMQANQSVHSNDEATAQIAGWNALVSANPSASLRDLYFISPSYANYFITPQGAWLSGVVSNPDNTVSQNSLNSPP